MHALHARFEKDPAGWTAPKAQIDAHYQDAERFASTLSIIGALITGFIGGAFSGRLYEWNKRSQDEGRKQA